MLELNVHSTIFGIYQDRLTLLFLPKGDGQIYGVRMVTRKHAYYRLLTIIFTAQNKKLKINASVYHETAKKCNHTILWRI